VRILLFTGKGGVGKSTVASGTAALAAAAGHRTLVLSTDAAHSLADAFGTPVGPEPTQVAENLFVQQVDAQLRFEQSWAEIQGYLLSVLDTTGMDPVAAEELTVIPGAEEVLALLELRLHALSDDWDLVVVDCAPTAETLRLLALPEALGWYLRKVFPAQRRIARGVRPFASMLGRGEAIPPDGLFEALLRLNEDLASVREILADPAVTTVRLVLTPEAVVAAEARRTFTALALYGYCVDLVVANRIFPKGRDAFRQGWVAAQQTQLTQLRESFAGVPVREVTYRAAEPVGVAALREVASTLYGELPGEDPAQFSAPGELMTVESDGDEFVLRIWLPLAARGAVEAARADDDLVLTVGEHRRVLTLPSVLRRCAVVRGEFADRELRVRFRRDPAVWPAPGRR
jgi:arsenite/tail-anchored protein-transporting ATPase